MPTENFSKTKHVESNILTYGMNKDTDPQLIKEGQYTHAINSQLNSQEGNFPFIQNEESTKFCTTTPYTYIGNIALKDKRFLLFSTNNSNSEIGIFEESSCKYTKLINDPCLNFNTSNLIKGVSKENHDCTESAYWCDDRNNNRTLNINNIPYKFTYADDACETKIYSNELDCDELELNSLISIPCITLTNAKSVQGKLKNGAYQVAVAYSIDNQAITDFYGTTLPGSIFSHENKGGALEVSITNLDKEFKEYKVYLLVTIAQQTTVYEVGVYSTTQEKIIITNISPENTTIPLSSLYAQRVINSKSENVLAINNQLLWAAPTTKPDLNYQLLANEIKAEWVAYAVPIEEDNSSIQSFMRDEVYPLGIKWKYTDGTKTNVYPLINREATTKEKEVINTEDSYELFLDNCDKKSNTKRWEVYNTASGLISNTELDKCEYKIIGRGSFAYIESLEKYPDNHSLYGDLSCTPIRHFKFPDDSIVPRTLKNSTGAVTHIIHLGVSLSNVQHPLDSSGTKLKNIQGFEIFRGDRTTEKSILGKGLLFNMGEYDFPISKDKKQKAYYPNYPFNDLTTDNFLSKTQTKGSDFGEKEYSSMGTFSNLYYTLHSPSFSFEKPSFGNELKIEGIESGATSTNFESVYKHPKNKILTDVAFIVAALLGLGEAYLATREKKIITTTVNSLVPIAAGTTVPALPAAMVAAITAYEAALKIADLDPNPITRASQIVAAKIAFETATVTAAAGGAAEKKIEETSVLDVTNTIPKILKALNFLYLFGFYFQKGFETGLNLIREFSKFEQYAYQANSYCYYDKFLATLEGKKRRYIEDINYLYPALQDFNGTTINNFRRESSVIIKLSRTLLPPTIKDNSRQTISQSGACDTKSYNATASSYYVAIKQNNPSQYGQIQNIKWIGTGHCNIIADPKNPSTKYTEDLILGGDTFINRFSVKRKFHYFNQTAFGENDGFEFDYRKYANIPYPRYWIDSEDYDLSEVVSLTPELPNDKAHLDCKKKKKFLDKLKSPMVLRDQYFYTSNNGVIDFYVESEINLANRDWEEQPEFRHYDKDRYTNLTELLRADYLEFDNRYIYDKSYSKELTENIGYTQNIYFDPLKVETCYTKFNNRVFWSLPSNKEMTKDNWRSSYLINNYYEFPLDAGNLKGMKVLDRTNIAFFFDKFGPYMHSAIDQLTTDGGIKVSIGDGALFARQPQPIITTDINYGSSSSKSAYTTSQYGVFYPSTDTQGRVFLLQGNSLNEISKENMHFWFQNNMEFKLLKDVPTFAHKDNTVVGIGFLTSYDNAKETYYLTKIDYKVKDPKNTVYEDDQFYFKNSKGFRKKINFKDPIYFHDTSWTVSYLPKLNAWVSFHDWHPNSIIQTEKHFISIKNDTQNKSSLWKHNERCDSFCTYYDTQYSWDVEYVVNNTQNTSSLSSVEYILETYRYDENCITNHHLLDYNFNHAYLYNTEQTSGILNLNTAAKGKLSKVLFYPKINSDSIDIECHKVEQKFRYNQFWDISKDRSEFNNNYISTQILEENGYRYKPNPDYLNYAKPPFERKRLRHNFFKVYMYREPTDIKDIMPKMILKFASTKELSSPR